MFDEIIEKNFPEMLERLAEIIRIPSIGGDRKGDMPYGEKCAEVLEKFLGIAGTYGFKTKNFENYAGTVEYNDKPVKLGVLCHLDVVPVTPEDWTYEPFGAQIDGGRMYGRGTIDDKGPAMAVLFALKALKDSGTDLTHNVRFIAGCDEERGSSDLDYYLTREKMPEYVFTPDGDYPVINIEKGMLRLRFEKNIHMEHIKKITGGTVVNAVPASAQAVVSGVDSFPQCENITVEKSGENSVITFRGCAAHASTPETGVNAITGLISYLAGIEGISDDERKLMTLLSERFVSGDHYGKNLGIEMKDERSGGLTAVLSIIDYDNDKLSMKMDIRYPLCGEKNDIKNRVRSSLSDLDAEMFTDYENDPHCVDENSEFVQTLLKVYHDKTGDEAYCKAIGGGTYVHDIEGGVAFGAEFPGEINNMHGNDESVSLDNLMLNTKIIAQAIYEICK